MIDREIGRMREREKGWSGDQKDYCKFLLCCEREEREERVSNRGKSDQFITSVPGVQKYFFTEFL